MSICTPAGRAGSSARRTLPHSTSFLMPAIRHGLSTSAAAAGIAAAPTSAHAARAARTHREGRRIAALLAEQALELAGRDQLLGLLRAADEHAAHEHHRIGRPAGPQLERAAWPPLAEVAAVLEVVK